MKIWNEGAKLFIEVAPKGENDRSAFFSELSGVLFAGWQDTNTVIYDTQAFSVRATSAQLRRIVLATNKRGYTVSDTARWLMQKIERKDKEEREIEQMIKEQRESRERAISKLKTGCGFCGLLSWDGDRYICGANGKSCATDSEEVERIYEDWKQTKVYARPTPFPHKECQYLEVLKV